jgi:hypothetical protein
VGFWYNAEAGWKPYAAQWTGTEWVLRPPAKPGSSHILTNVSCTSTAACTAVGYYQNALKQWVALAESWNGFGWTTQATKTVEGAESAYLFGNSCNGSLCSAVGQASFAGGSFKGLAEYWNGSEWTLKTYPTPSESDVRLQGVSCTTSTNCEAVGWLRKAGVYRTTAGVWNGSEWSEQVTPEISESTETFFYGVSCPAASECIGVGIWKKASGAGLTLTERYK